MRLIRADSGFYQDDWLSLLESQGLPYIVVAELQIKLQRLIRKETRWEAGKATGPEVAVILYEGASRRERRIKAGFPGSTFDCRNCIGVVPNSRLKWRIRCDEWL